LLLLLATAFGAGNFHNCDRRSKHVLKGYTTYHWKSKSRQRNAVNGKDRRKKPNEGKANTFRCATPVHSASNGLLGYRRGLSAASRRLA
jgi:hypothetical protein